MTIYAAPSPAPDLADSPGEPQLNDIGLFIEVARRSSFSRAAENLGVPATTVSRRLRQLEASLGVSLLVRTTRRIALTEAGQLYFDQCSALIDQVRDAQSVLHGIGVKPRGTLTVLLPEPLDALGFADIAREFAERWPELKYRFDYVHDPVLDPSRDFDIALRWGQQADSDLVARRLADIPHQLHAAPSYLNTRGEPRTPADLARHECLRSDLCGEMATWTLECEDFQADVPVSGALASNNLELLRKFAASGAGIIALPTIGPSDPTMVPVLPRWRLAPIPLYAVFPSRKAPTRTRMFLEFLEERIGELVGQYATA